MHSNNSLVSVIVPIYNVELYVEKCVDSILAQSYTHIEVVLVNDGSTDNSLQIIEKYRTDDRCLIVNKPNGGQSSARNAGLDVAKGSFVYFIDSDDYIARDAIAQLLNCIEQHQADFCCYRIAFYNEDSDRRYIHGRDFQFECLYGNDHIMKDAFLGCNIKTTVWSKFWRRSFLIEHNLRFCQGLKNEDTIFTLTASIYANRVCFLNKVLYYALVRQTSISRDIKQDNITNYVEVYQLVGETLQKEGKFTIYESYYWASYAKSILYTLVLCAVKSSSFKQYLDLYCLLKAQPYVVEPLKCAHIALGSRKLALLYKLSLFPRLFRLVIKLLKKTGISLNSI